MLWDMVNDLKSPLMALFAAGLMLVLMPVQATAEADDWQGCVAALRAGAIEEGIDAQTVDSVLAGVEQLPRVISQDRQQPEFTKTFADYYNVRVSETRTARGRELLREHHALLSRVAHDSGVPPHYLVALWGLETNFGSYFGNLSLPSALTTLACDGRRSQFFTRQLFAALRIVEAGDMRAEDMVGSWAGAIGHMQFMPTTFLAHARDGDADGRRDLLGSLPDALTSGAHYLQDIGWAPGYRWGREVRLPEGFDYAASGSDNWQPLSVWREKGVTDTFGNLLAATELSSAILIPSGHTGPAFVVYPNFNVLMKWNRSEFYAISVGRLADRIAGAGKLHTPPPQLKIETEAVMAMQQQLAALGYEPGPADGILGPGTRKAIQAFEKRNDMVADGYPDPQLFSAVAAAAARASSPSSSG